jgi:hypothetical protein
VAPDVAMPVTPIVLNGCVPLKTYLKMFGENEHTINMRIQRGHWRQGKEFHKIKGVRERWIDLEAVTEWARQNSEA